MTFKQEVIKYLTERGMFDEDAEKIVDTLRENKAMIQRWQDQSSWYPPQMLDTILLSAKREALAWIEKNMPAAWFRPMFEDGEQ